MRRELANVDFATWYTYINGQQNTGASVLRDVMVSISGSVGASSYYAYFVLPEFLPETVNQYMRLANKNSRSALESLAGEVKNKQDDWQIVGAPFYNEAGERGWVEAYTYGDDSERKRIQDWAKTLLPAADQQPDIRKPLYCITYNEVESYGDSYQYSYYVNAPDDQAPPFAQFTAAERGSDPIMLPVDE